MNIKKDFRMFIDSLVKLDKRFLLVLFFQISFIVISAVLFMLWNSLLSSQAAKIPDIETATIDQADQFFGSVRSFIVVIILSSVALVLLFLANYALFGSLTWTKILKKKFSNNTFRSFFWFYLFGVPLYYLMLSLFGFFIIKNLFSLLLLKTTLLYLLALPIFIFIIFPLTLYIFNTLNMISLALAQREKIWMSIKEGFGNAISPKLYTHYIFASLLLMVISAIIYPFQNFRTAYTVVSIITFLLFAIWLKFYTAQVLATKHKAKK